MTGPRPCACVLGSMDLVRPLGLAGIRCVVAARAGAPPRFSRFTAARLEWTDPWRHPDVLARTLLAFAAAQAAPPVLFYEEDGDLLFISRWRDALARAFHFVVLGALGALVLVFAANRATLRETFFKVVADLQGGTVAGHAHARHGLLHELDNLFTTSSAHLHLLGGVLLAYAAVEGVEAVGLWNQQRWAEYLTFLVTSSLLPLEVYEIANRASPLKILAFVLNVVIVIYLLLAKRLFGLRGGIAADAAEAKRDQGWEALERASPPLPPAREAPPARA